MALVTHFASAERASEGELSAQLAAVSAHPLAAKLLDAFGGILLVVNEQRQVIAVNAALLQKLGIDDPHSLLGARPGEALHCAHAAMAPGGCGTGRGCASCGAVIAILASQAECVVTERECLLTTEGGGSLAFRVRAAPLQLAEHRFTALTLQDIQVEKEWETAQRVFFHDLANLMTGLLGAVTELEFCEPHETAQLLADVQSSVRSMVDETRAQRAYFYGTRNTLPLLRPISLGTILDEIARIFVRNPLARQRRLQLGELHRDVTVRTDSALLRRILVNMVKNALEASPPEGRVAIWCEILEERVSFKVHNVGAIPEATAVRIFERHFTTKEGPGRGLGTFGMKLFGEQVLGGKVSFESNEEQGTTFCFELPQPRSKTPLPGS